MSVVTLTANTTAIIDGELTCMLLGLIAESKLKHFLQLPLNNNNNNSNNIFTGIVLYNWQSAFTYIISFNLHNK